MSTVTVPPKSPVLFKAHLDAAMSAIHKGNFNAALASVRNAKLAAEGGKRGQK